MNILFSGVPAYGHLLPMLPLAGAADRAGHRTALMTSGAMARATGPLPLLPVGPSFEELLAENARRTGGMGSGDGSEVGPAEAADFFGGTRVDVTVEDALAAATSFAPDLLVCDAADRVGPLVAAALQVPWAQHGFGVQLPEAFAAALDRAATLRFEERGLRPTAAVAYLDPCVDFLQLPGWVPAARRLAVRPQAHDRADVAWQAPDFAQHPGRPRVLVSFGTVVDDTELVPAVLASLAASQVNAVVTVGPDRSPDEAVVDRSSVLPVGFVPLAQLLRGAAAVVCAGGAGTVLGALAEGVPLIVLPVFASQRWNGGQAAAAGAAIVLEEAGRAGAAVDLVLGDPSYRDAARSVAQAIAAMPSPDQALGALLTRVPARSGPHPRAA